MNCKKFKEEEMDFKVKMFHPLPSYQAEPSTIMFYSDEYDTFIQIPPTFVDNYEFISEEEKTYRGRRFVDAIVRIKETTQSKRDWIHCIKNGNFYSPYKFRKWESDLASRNSMPKNIFNNFVYDWIPESIFFLNKRSFDDSENIVLLDYRGDVYVKGSGYLNVAKMIFEEIKKIHYGE